ncbi:MAG: PhnD/SsuA/transferrin family substrate-binding protein [Aquamicrobium sp.]|uniref:phosphate/phosphite/phosphonate ABC transporter substrate-binding protein n=1 Tax=Aquamicrobium sp. TaxID=1872579 RepID=UPI00349EF219|nr:PhnD/SsuA/transferrin family substrate-binding protein [Aquamicrobium sp.]
MTATAVSLAALSCGPGALAQEAFRIGLVALPGEDASVEGLAGIKAAYSAALGMPVEVMVARDYAALAEAQIAGRIDYAAYSAPAFAAASLRCGCVVPVAAPVDADGSVGLRSVLIVRPGFEEGSGRLAVGPADSLATRLAPLAASDEARAAAASGRLVETASAAEAEALFLSGKVDGFFGWTPARAENATEPPPGGTPARLAASGLDPSAWRIAWRSDTLRYGPHAVRSDIAPGRVEKLAGLLESVAPGEAGPGRQIMRGHDRFAAVSPADYRAVLDAVAALGTR